MGDHYRTAQFLAAIPGSGGIIAHIARKVGCSWDTAKKYIDRHPTVNAAYTEEAESVLDLAESIVRGNLILAHNKQVKDGEIVDTGDARWFLATKGKHRGFTERHEEDHSGVVTLNVVYHEGNGDSP